MNRLHTALLGALAGAVPVALTRHRSERTLTDEVLAAYRRGHQQGRVDEWRYLQGLPERKPDARQVAGIRLVERWKGLGLAYYAARLREVDRRLAGLHSHVRASAGPEMESAPVVRPRQSVGVVDAGQTKVERIEEPADRLVRNAHLIPREQADYDHRAAGRPWHDAAGWQHSFNAGSEYWYMTGDGKTWERSPWQGQP